MKFVKLIYFIGVIGLGYSCQMSGQDVSEQSAGVSWSLASRSYDKEELVFNRLNSLWLLKTDSTVISGIVKAYYPDGRILQAFELVEGKRQGMAYTYFPDGRVRFQESYHQNRLHGTVKRWTMKNGYQLLARLQYVDGRLHGEQKKWYDTGELHKQMHLNRGKEDGLQQAFRKNGALYANYEARNGRIYGLKRSNLCYELDNEKIVWQQ